MKINKMSREQLETLVIDKPVSQIDGYDWSDCYPVVLDTTVVGVLGTPDLTTMAGYHDLSECWFDPQGDCFRPIDPVSTGVIESIIVDRYNLDHVQDIVAQRSMNEELAEVVQESSEATVSVFKDDGSTVLVFHDTNRAGVCYNGDTTWGDWLPDKRLLRTDDGLLVNVWGDETVTNPGLDLDPGVYVEDDGYTVVATSNPDCRLRWHKGEMPAHSTEYLPSEEMLLVRMEQIAPLKDWKPVTE